MKIIAHHSGDLDGFCSGAITRHALRISGVPTSEIRMVGVEYGQDFSWVKNLGPEDDLYVTDFCFEPFPIMLDAKARCRTMTWIDHHRSAIREAAKHEFGTMGLCREGFSACELAWEFFFGTESPPVVHHLGRHDVFDHSNPRSLPVQLFYETLPWTEPNAEGSEENWLRTFNLTEAGLEDIIKAGQLLLAYRTAVSRREATKAHVVKFEGLTFIAMNTAGKGSHIFDTVFDRAKHDAMLVYSLKPGVTPAVQVSLYGGIDSPHDLSVIATKYGGGGHAGACGFKMRADQFLEALRIPEVV
jgi:oligoribonuclease NrnB/cAMP/cGMP phosphodiesterase (DHH superfamily)